MVIVMMGSILSCDSSANGPNLHCNYPLGEKKLLLGTNPPFYIAKLAMCEDSVRSF